MENNKLLFENKPMAFHVFLKNYDYDIAADIVTVIELLILILSFISIYYFLKFLRKHSLLHINFRILCVNNCLGSVVYSILRIVMFGGRIVIVLPENIYEHLFYMRDGMHHFFILNLTTILFERWFSTRYISFYETYFKIYHAAFLFCFPWFACLALSIAIEILPLSIFMSIIITINGVFLTGFIALFYYNKNLLKGTKNKSLSTVFQVRENIKTLKVMSWISIIFVLHILISILIVAVSLKFGRNLDTINSYIFWHSIFNAFFSIQCFLVSGSFLIMYLKKRKTTVDSLPQNNSADEQRKMYFAELRRQWT